MRMRRSILRVAACVVAGACHAFAQTGGETAFEAPANPADPTTPLVLKIAVNDIYCKKTACDCIGDIAIRDFAGLIKELREKHRITLEMSYFMEVFDLEKEILKGAHHGVICKPWTALRLAGKANADFKRVADLRDPDNSAMMTGVFMTLKDSPVKSLDDLAGKHIALGQADSYEKHQSPLAMLAARKVSPGTCPTYSSCGENLDALMSGKVDAAVVSSYALTASCAVDFAKPGDFRTIGETEPMPLTSLLLDMKRVSPADAARLQKALIALSGDDVPGDLDGTGFILPVSWKPAAPGSPSTP